MNTTEPFAEGLEVAIRLAALERRWGRPRAEIYAEALHECQGVTSKLNELLKSWQYPTPDALRREVERMFSGGSWTMWSRGDV